MLNTAHEYEEKNPAPASFPQVGNSGSLFGSAPSGTQGGLFGAAPTGKGSVSYKEGRKPKPRPKAVKCTHNYRYDKDGNLDPSSSNTGFFRGSLFDGSAPKLGFNNNIFMIDGNIAKEEEEAAASQPSTEVEKQSSDAGPSDMAP